MQIKGSMKSYLRSLIKYRFIHTIPVVLAAMAIISLINYASAQFDYITDDLIFYENPLNGIKISYPSSWEKVEGSNHIIFYPSPNTFDELSLNKTGSTTNFTLTSQNYNFTEVPINEFIYERITSLNNSLTDFKLEARFVNSPPKCIIHYRLHL